LSVSVIWLHWSSGFEFLRNNPLAALCVVGFLPIGAAFLLVRYFVWQFRNHPESTAHFASERDEWIANAQFYSVLVLSIVLPVVVVGVAQGF
jgi:hypothetical protein